MYKQILILFMPFILFLLHVMFSPSGPPLSDEERKNAWKETKKSWSNTMKNWSDDERKKRQKVIKETKEKLDTIAPEQEKCLDAKTAQDFVNCIENSNDKCKKDIRDGKINNYSELLKCINNQNSHMS